MKRKRNSKGQFRANRVITFFKLPKVIQTITDLLTCSYWLKVAPKCLCLRQLDYLLDIAKVFKLTKEGR